MEVARSLHVFTGAANIQVGQKFLPLVFYPAELLAELRWDFPRPGAAVYTFPDEPRAPSLLLSTYSTNEVTRAHSSSQWTVKVNIHAHGYELDNRSVFDCKWSLSCRRLRKVLDMENCVASRRRLRALIERLNNRLPRRHSRQQLQSLKTASWKTLLAMFVDLNLLYTRMEAGRLDNLCGSCDVSFETIAYQGHVMALSSVIPQFREGGAQTTGHVVGKLSGGFLIFQPIGAQIPIRVHEIQLEPIPSGLHSLCRSLGSAAECKSLKESELVCRVIRDTFERHEIESTLIIT